jgi:hypothetical protein
MSKSALPADPSTPSWDALGYFTEQQMRDLRGVKAATLRNERCLGAGPPYVRFGRDILYPKKQFADWLARQVVARNRPGTLAADGKTASGQPIRRRVSA